MKSPEIIHSLRIIADYIEAHNGEDKDFIIETLAKIGDELSISEDKLKRRNLQIADLKARLKEVKEKIYQIQEKRAEKLDEHYVVCELCEKTYNSYDEHIC